MDMFYFVEANNILDGITNGCDWFPVIMIRRIHKTAKKQFLWEKSIRCFKFKSSFNILHCISSIFWSFHLQKIIMLTIHYDFKKMLFNLFVSKIQIFLYDFIVIIPVGINFHWAICLNNISGAAFFELKPQKITYCYFNRDNYATWN